MSLRNMPLETQMVEWSYSSTLFNLGAQWGACATPTSGKEIRWPLYRRSGGPQSRSGVSWRRNILFYPTGFEFWTVQLVGSVYNIYMIKASPCRVT